MVQKEAVEESEIKKITKPEIEDWNHKAMHLQGTETRKGDKVKIAVCGSGIDLTDNINIKVRKNFIAGE